MEKVALTRRIFSSTISRRYASAVDVITIRVFRAAVFATNSVGLRKIANNSSKLTSRMLIDTLLTLGKAKTVSRVGAILS